MGFQDRGRALGNENRPRFYRSPNDNNINYLLTKLRLWLTDDVALQPRNLSRCLTKDRSSTHRYNLSSNGTFNWVSMSRLVRGVGMSTAERIAWGLLSFIVLIVWLRWEGTPEDQRKGDASRGAEAPGRKRLINLSARRVPRSAWARVHGRCAELRALGVRQTCRRSCSQQPPLTFGDFHAATQLQHSEFAVALA